LLGLQMSIISLHPWAAIACKHPPRAQKNWRSFSLPTHDFYLGRTEGPQLSSLWHHFSSYSSCIREMEIITLI
jgi:hypothetical protein